VSINDRYGITGLRSDYLRGIQRVAFQWSPVAFTPVYFYGFRMSLFLFAESAAVSYSTKPIWTSQFYHGIGGGIRLRNEHLVFKTLQLRLAYYPDAPPDASRFSTRVLGEDLPGFIDLGPRRPAPIPYR
jgi:hypothetical protein